MDKQMQFLIYNTSEEQVSIDVLVKDDSIWTTQKAMSELFGCRVDNISVYLKNIYESNELQRNRTIEEIPIVRQEGSRKITRKIAYYNLDAIISVGYRVNSAKATKFRIWATQVLKEYMIERENTFNMEKFAASVNEFLTFRRYDILPDKVIWQTCLPNFNWSH